MYSLSQQVDTVQLTGTIRSWDYKVLGLLGPWTISSDYLFVDRVMDYPYGVNKHMHKMEQLTKEKRKSISQYVRIVRRLK